jgi:chromosomal replication initiator protein
MHSAANASELWAAALGELELQVNRSNFRTWFQKTDGVSYQDGVLTVAVPNAFVAEYLERNQRSLVEKTVINLAGDGTRLAFAVVGGPAPAATEALAPPSRRFNTGYTFDSFVTGDCNSLAYAAAQRVSECPGQSYNPLYIYSGCGLGKTHLLQAIGQAAQRRRQKVVYTSAEQYTNEFVGAIRRRSTEDFHAKYRSADMLLVDDIQFIAGKEQTEECFFHTFNDLHNTNRQIVITCDSPPKSIRLEDRLVSRFGWGLIVDIQPPDLETRLAILEEKAAAQQQALPVEVMQLIAERSRDSVRELEGALNRVLAFARLLGRMPNLEIAHKALDDLSAKTVAPASPVAPDAVLTLVAAAFQVNLEDILGRQRDKRTTLARQVCMYLMKQVTGESLVKIGQAVGGRDHSTVIHACGKITEALPHNAHLAGIVEGLRAKLTKGG